MEKEIKQILRNRLGKEMSDFTIEAITSDLVKLIKKEKRISFEEGYVQILTKNK